MNPLRGARVTFAILIGTAVFFGCSTRETDRSNLPDSPSNALPAQTGSPANPANISNADTALTPTSGNGCAPVDSASQQVPPRGIYRMRADGSELCLLAIAGVRADNPVWSPDGQYIVFTTARERASH